jgi:SnoaL-like domain
MKLTSSIGRIKHLWWLSAVLFCGSSQVWADSQDEVEDLAVCYAYGTDALGSAVNASIEANLDSTANLADPQFAKGLGFYRKCFAKQFSFTLEFDGVPVLTVPDPATRTASTDAALQWANFVNNAFRGPGYRNTQHHMGSISSEVQAQSASMTSYLIATHAFGPTSSQTGVNVVGGTYRDDVVRKNGRWLIAQRTLNITSAVVTPGP